MLLALFAARFAFPMSGSLYQREGEGLALGDREAPTAGSFPASA